MPAGRPRSEAARSAILAATREELAAEGYDKLTIDRVALRAGVAKQTVYRWYSSKAELVAEGLLQGFVGTPTVPTQDGTDARSDVHEWVRGFATISHDPQAVALIRAAGAAAAENKDIARGFQEQMRSLARASLAQRMDRAAEAGELRRDTPSAAVAEIIVGALIYRLITHEEITDHFVDDLVQTIFDGIAAHSESTANS